MLSIAAVCAAVFAFAPSPYVIERPGPVYDTLGEVEIEGSTVPVISISGAPTFETSGSLDMLTVSIVGNREHPLSWLQAGAAWFSPDQKLLPIDAIFPAGQTSEQQSEQNQALMVNSQQDAVAAALLNLGYSVGRDVTVQGFADSSPADGVLEVGDIITEANGVPVQSVTQLRKIINELGGAAVPLTVSRAGETLSVSVAPVTASDGSYVLGIGATVAYTFPLDVTFQLDDVGGPSAGMMFALGIITKMTSPGTLVNGKRWAGTGTIDSDGNIGPIGGIQQKMRGARSAGAEYMLAPRGNCDEVTGHIPAGLDVYAVGTLDQAKTVVETIASGAATSQLERCPAG